MCEESDVRTGAAWRSEHGTRNRVLLHAVALIAAASLVLIGCAVYVSSRYQHLRMRAVTSIAIE
jgi:hypothetical protein